jgi:archaellum component FlaC
LDKLIDVYNEISDKLPDIKNEISDIKEELNWAHESSIANKLCNLLEDISFNTSQLEP